LLLPLLDEPLLIRGLSRGSGQPRQELTDPFELGDAEIVVELSGSRPLQVREVREKVAVDSRGVRNDNHLSSVGGINLAAYEAAFLEPVDHASDGTGAQPGELGEPSCWRRPVKK